MSRAIPVLAAFGLMAAACGKPEPQSGPPEIAYGEATCSRCGMILKDPRFAGPCGSRNPEEAPAS